ncbi:MAG: efflux RND transporter periplasmic adaptor subunit, partial [Gemmatimonadales bacterium]|nr:efflux RND transporter periplasmic adaptor subunit [Gemmatimonadales bacterium]
MIRTTAALLLLLGACKQETPAPVYEAVPVQRRDIVVSAQASGSVQPDTTVEVKSKASGEVLELRAETGQVVKRGALLLQIDPRTARNALAQAQANLDVARAQLANATSQKARADALFKSQSITQQESEAAVLDFANAKAAVVNARVAVDNARIQLEDTDVRAPIAGTIIEKDAERGQVISSATSNVSGGTVLMKMADLRLVQVRTLVDETDIGKVTPEQRATVTVDAYPERPFEGRVIKIEPQATDTQNVTMFPVLVRIENRDGLLRPGMNAEVEIHVGRRDRVLAVPTSALRTQRDVASAAQVLGLRADAVQQQLAAQTPARTASSDNRNSGTGGGRYIVFVKRGGAPRPTWIRTGLSDLDYSEALNGVSAGDSVLVLPSASLVVQQQEMQIRIQRATGGGGVPGMQQQGGSQSGRQRGARGPQGT